MNSSSAVTTGAAGVSAAMLAGVITWLCTRPLTAPPPDVSMGLAALALAGVHGLVNWISARWPAQTPAVEPEPPTPAPKPIAQGAPVTAPLNPTGTPA
jgi:hypothetical protein